MLEAAEAGVPVPPEAVEKTKMVMEAHLASVSKAIGAGVKVAMGTDSGVTPHGQNLRELPLMVECGMSPAEALVATTRTAAELLGIADDTGTLEPGKVADVVVLAGDALDLARPRRTGAARLPGRHARQRGACDLNGRVERRVGVDYVATSGHKIGGSQMKQTHAACGRSRRARHGGDGVAVWRGVGQTGSGLRDRS